MILVHGTCVELAGVGVGAGIGVLLRGPPGSGKSDLALRLIGAGARLVADDQVEIRRAGDGLTAAALIAAAPPAIAGLLEVRGLGPVRLAAAGTAPLGLVIDLVGAAAVDRLPPPATAEYQGVALPLYRLAPFEASAPDKVRLAADSLKTDLLAVS